MADPKWGSKRICQGCGCKFYDMGKDPIECPKCGTVFDPEAILKSRRPRPVAKPVEVKKPEPKAASDDDDLDLEDDLDVDDDDNDDSVLDASDLDDSDDDLGDVVIEKGEDESS